MTPEELIRNCTDRHLLLAVAESCTGGLLAGAITSVPGSSRMFAGGIVAYSNTSKSNVLGVSRNTLDRYGAVSEPVALAMAEGAGQLFGVDISVAVTGIAGPGSSNNKPEGRVCFALNDLRTGMLSSRTVEFGTIGRSVVRERSVETALLMVAGILD